MLKKFEKLQKINNLVSYFIMSKFFQNICDEIKDKLDQKILF